MLIIVCVLLCLCRSWNNSSNRWYLPILPRQVAHNVGRNTGTGRGERLRLRHCARSFSWTRWPRRRHNKGIFNRPQVAETVLPASYLTPQSRNDVYWSTSTIAATHNPPGRLEISFSHCSMVDERTPRTGGQSFGSRSAKQFQRRKSHARAYSGFFIGRVSARFIVHT